MRASSVTAGVGVAVTVFVTASETVACVTRVTRDAFPLA